MRIEFKTDHYPATETRDAVTIVKALHSSNAAILGTGGTEKQALLSVLESVRQAFESIELQLDADELAYTIAEIRAR